MPGEGPGGQTHTRRDPPGAGPGGGRAVAAGRTAPADRRTLRPGTDPARPGTRPRGPPLRHPSRTRPRTRTVAGTRPRIRPGPVVPLAPPAAGPGVRGGSCRDRRRRCRPLGPRPERRGHFTTTVNRVLFQLRPHDTVLWAPLVRYLTDVRSARRTVVIDDRATTTSSWNTTKNVVASPPSRGSVSTQVVPAGSEDFGPAARAVLTKRAQAVVFAGTSPHRAATCAEALRRAGFTGTCVATQPVLERSFLTEAGAASEGWVFCTTYVDPAGLPRAQPFVHAYLRRFGTRRVGRYATEAYDAVFFLARGIHSTGEQTAERGALVRRLRSVTYDGLAKTLEFRPPSYGFVPDRGLFLYRVENGDPHFLGPFAQAVKG
ncbi:ABC transporter substrate-binding protein [Streptomyces sp. NPDC006923]|uniref:ABC transporter substrate-binding protein n=1 Tax=Streptomyces sp. NPDC006923 TaxID=3155355 RepID=UPI0033F2CF4A